MPRSRYALAMLHVPREYKDLGITTPEEAAKYSADVSGILSCHHAKDHAEWAEREGRTADAEFYWQVLDILLQWYDQPLEPVTGDEDLPEPPDAMDDKAPKPAGPSKPRRRKATRKRAK